MTRAAAVAVWPIQAGRERTFSKRVPLAMSDRSTGIRSGSTSALPGDDGARGEMGTRAVRRAGKKRRVRERKGAREVGKEVGRTRR